jgi:hypothetical protein
MPPLTPAEYAQQITDAAQRGDTKQINRLARGLADETMSDEQRQQQQRTDPTGQPIVPPEQFNAMSADQLVALQESDPGLYNRSIAAAAAPVETGADQG